MKEMAGVRILGPRIAVGILTFALVALAPSALAVAPEANPAGIEGAADGVRALIASRESETPNLAVEKASDASGVLSRGDVFSYTLTVSNVGGSTAHRVVVFDQLPPGLTIVTLLPVIDGGTCTTVSGIEPGGVPVAAVRCTLSSLDAGGSASVAFDVRVGPDVSCGALENTAEVSANDEPEQNVGPENFATHFGELECLPSLSLSKTGPVRVHVGDAAPYRFVVQNDGDGRLVDVVLEDPSCDDSPSRVGGSAVSLSPGRSWTFVCTHTVAGSDGDPISSSATARARDEDGAVVKSSDGHTMDVIHPKLRLIHTITPHSGTPGDVVTYTYRVTNLGDTPLSDVVITDEVNGAVGSFEFVKPGQTRSLELAYTLPSSDVHPLNAAAATARDPLGLQVSDTDEAFVTIVAETTPPGGENGGTPFTGGRVARPASAAAALTLLGIAFVAASRRRRTEP